MLVILPLSLLIQLHANICKGKAVGYGSSTWVPTNHVEDLTPIPRVIQEAGQIQEPKNSSDSCLWIAQSQVVEPSSAVLSGTLAGSWIGTYTFEAQCMALRTYYASNHLTDYSKTPAQ